MINKPDEYTFSRSKNEGRNISKSVIDLAFATNNLHSKVSNWFIDESNETDSDHQLIQMSIRTNDVQLIDNSLMSGSFNIKKADWEKFEKDLKYEAKLHESTFESMNSFEELEAAALKLQEIIQKAAESSIPLRRFSEKSKVW